MTLEILCPTCNMPLKEGQGECPNCGTILEAALVGEILPAAAKKHAHPIRKKKTSRTANRATKARSKPALFALLEKANQLDGAAQSQEALGTYRLAREEAAAEDTAQPGIASLIPLLDLKIQDLEIRQSPTPDGFQDDSRELLAAAQYAEAFTPLPAGPKDHAQDVQAVSGQQDQLSPVLLASLLGWIGRGPYQGSERQETLVRLLDSDSIIPSEIQITSTSAPIAVPLQQAQPAGTQPGWRRYLSWVVANSVGIGLILGIGNLATFSYRYYAWPVILLAFLFPGLILGSLQLPFIKGYLSNRWGWVLTTAAGTSIVYTSATYITGGDPLAGLVWSAAATGLLIGAVQYYFFLKKIKYAEYWILCSSLGWLISGLACNHAHILWGVLIGLPSLGILTALGIYLLENITGQPIFGSSAETGLPASHPGPNSTVEYAHRPSGLRNEGWAAQIQPRLARIGRRLKHDWKELFRDDMTKVGGVVALILLGMIFCGIALVLILVFS